MNAAASQVDPTTVAPGAGPIGYAVLAGDVEHEIEVRRSRFICRLHRVDDEAAARDAIELARTEHRLARHHCSAFVLGPDRRIRRSNDDGEPAGTAGTPMLDAIVQRATGIPAVAGVAAGSAGEPSVPDARGGPDAQAELSDVVAVVIRYFGGVLLGAGGLVRAYSDAVSSALDVSRLVARERRRVVALDAPHSDAGRWEHELRASGAVVLGSDYGARDVRLRLAVVDAPAAFDALEHRVAALAQGARSLETLGTEWVDLG